MSDGNGLQVVGGAGGLTADLEAMQAAAAVLLEAGADLAVLAARVAALAVDPDLALSAALDLPGFLAVQRELLPLTTGPSGLGACAARVTALGVAVSGAARAYGLTEEATAALARRLRHETATLVGAGAGVGLVAGLGGLLATSPVGALVEVDGVLRRLDPRSMADWAAWLAAHPGVAEDVVGGLPGFLDGLTGPLVTGSPATPGAVTWPPRDARGLAAALAALAGVSPLFVDGTVRVWRVGSSSSASSAAPVETAGVAGALSRLVPYSPPRREQDARPRTPFSAVTAGVPYQGERIRLERIDRNGKTSWAVYVPPTQTWALTGGPNPFDGSTNVLSVAGRATAAGQAVTNVLQQAGARAGEPVLLAGYSQGGLTALQLASDGAFRKRFTVTTVLTAASPGAVFDVPDDVAVLSLEHDQDFVPMLDGARNPDLPSWTTVRRDLTDPGAAGPGLVDDLRQDPFTAHRIEYYLDTAALVDASDDESVLAWQRAAQPFLDQAGADVTVTEWEATRVAD